MTLGDMMLLAHVYRKAAGISLTTLGRLATGNNRTLCRIAAGRGCHSSTLERAAAWLTTHWPDDVPWPLDVPRQVVPDNRPDAAGEARAGGSARSIASGRDCER